MAAQRRARGEAIEVDIVDGGLRKLKAILEEITSRPKVTARDAEEAAEAARALADLLRAEERAVRLLRGAEPSRPGSPTLAGLTLHEAARRVLERDGWPMHVRDLGVRIKAAGWRHPRSTRARPDQIEFQLAARLAKHPEIFRKFAPNTFGLTVWGDAPPKKGRPRPHVGLFRSPAGSPPASRIDEELDRYFDEEPNRWR